VPKKNWSAVVGARVRLVLSVRAAGEAMSDADWRDRLRQQLFRRSRIWATLVVVSLSCAAGGLSVLTSRPSEAPAAGLSAPPPPSAALVSAPASASTSAPEGSPAAESEKVPLVQIITEGEISRGQTLSTSLRERGVSAAAVHRIATEMAPVFDFRYAHPGDSYRLTQDENGDVLFFRYSRSPLEHYTIERQGEGYRATLHEPELVRRRARIAGVVSTTLYEAVEALGEEAELANDFAEIFAWDVDFSRTVQPGDEFSILYERLLLKGDDRTETYVRPGRILAGRYTTGLQEYTAIYFEQAEGKGGYYRTDGSSVQRQLLRAPLNYRRVSSRFSHSRLHPILKVRRPHLGIDYAAPYGTPVWAVADGKVIFRGVRGGLGRLVKVRHANGYVSYYGHLSRYPKGLRVGQWVHQKEVVGYVGSTGISTGPHLHYQLMKYGRAVDPAAVRTPAGDPIPGAARERFAEVRDDLLRELDPTPLVVLTNEAG
jgi:murein DD-endopeptidase MepM/ murein hydrolase activator NlpD